MHKKGETTVKQTWKPGNMLYPLPAVMVSVTDGKGEERVIDTTDTQGNQWIVNGGLKQGEN